MMRRVVILAVVACVWVLPAWASLSAEALKESAQFIMKKLGKEAGAETVDTISVRLERLAARHGDDAVRMLEKADGPQMAKLLARYGDDGLYLAGRPDAVKLYARYGDDAAEALIKHKGLESVVEKVGKDGAAVLKKLDRQQAVQFGIMADSGELAKIGRTPELLAVINKYGNKGMEFVWKHKGALAVSATLAVFLANPQPFIDGTLQLAEHTTDAVVKPLAEAPGEAAKEAAKHTNWTLVAGLCIGLTAVWLILRSWLLIRRHRRMRQQ